MLDTIIFDNDIILSNKDAYENFHDGLRFVMRDNINTSLSYVIQYATNVTEGAGGPVYTWSNEIALIRVEDPTTHYSTYSWNTSALSIPSVSALWFHVASSPAGSYTTTQLPLKKYVPGGGCVIEHIREFGAELPITNKTVTVEAPYNRTVNIGTSAWSGTTATVSVEGIGVNDDIMIAPHSDSTQTVVDNGIYCSGQADGQLTFTCTTVPSSAVAFSAWWYKATPPNYLCFTANTAGSTIGIERTNELAPARDFKYKINDGEWTAYIATTPATMITLTNVGDKIYWKGNNPDGINIIDLTYYHIFRMTGSIAGSGNIMSIIDNGACNTTTIPCVECFKHFFDGCTSLTYPPELPATTLKNSCYYEMFHGCTGFTDLSGYSFSSNFASAQSECNNMFSHCSNMTKAPALPSTQLGAQCYRYMFEYCTSLTHGPELPATTGAGGCYGGMFVGCTALRNVPSIQLTTLYDGDCQNMFGSTGLSLTAAPDETHTIRYRIPYTGTATESYETNPPLGGMFGTQAPTPVKETIYYINAASVNPPVPTP